MHKRSSVGVVPSLSSRHFLIMESMAVRVRKNIRELDSRGGLKDASRGLVRDTVRLAETIERLSRRGRKVSVDVANELHELVEATCIQLNRQVVMLLCSR